jgi:hypothetical protein
VSNTTAIAAVTRALCALFNKIPTIPTMPDELGDLKVTATPPDHAGTDSSATYLNVFLYQVANNAAFRNMSVPRQLPASATASPPPDIPPVGLDLDYLITAYGKDNDDTLAHLALAAAVSVLADNACISPQLIQSAVNTSGVAVSEIDLYLQKERIRVAPKPLTIEELSKLWTIFQAKYRISVSYQVSVVLIDGAQPPRDPLPVVSYTTRVTTRTPFSSLAAIALPNGRPTALLGDTVILSGDLDAGSGTLSVLFQSPLVAAPLSGTITAQSPGTVKVTIPNDAAAQTAWPAGLYVVSVRFTGPTPVGGGTPRTHTTSALPLALAPRIVHLSVTPPPPQSATSTVMVQCSPQVWPGQRVFLLVGNHEIAAPTITALTPQLSFPASGVPAGTYFVRLRVDGVDSVLADYTKPPPVLDAAQQVTLP